MSAAISDFLSKEEIVYSSRRDNNLAWRTVIVSWLSLLAVFWFATTWANPLTLVIAIVLLAGRQLSLAIIMHDCDHNTLFQTQQMNLFCGQWFGAAPNFADLKKYASGHSVHHKLAGSAEDPDLPNYRAYPVSRASFKRKIFRDLTGQTGYTLLRYVVTQAMGIFASNLEQQRRLPGFC